MATVKKDVLRRIRERITTVPADIRPKTTVTVADIREAIQDLPGYAPVFILPASRPEYSKWGYVPREGMWARTAHMGMFGNSFVLELGGFVKYWESAEEMEEHKQRELDDAGESERSA